MSSSEGAALLEGARDLYEGIRVKSSGNPCGRAEFGPRLRASLESWRGSGVRGCWVEISLKDAEWVPECAAQGFTFHHARDDEVVMVAWLQPTPNQLPRYPFTQVGVGGLVMDGEGRVLMMRELRGRYLGWKFPGGLVDPGEELEAGCAREVEEETGVPVSAKGVLAWRHSHTVAPYPHTADLYFLLLAEPKGPGPHVPKPCALEAADSRWFTEDEIRALDDQEHLTAYKLWALDLAKRYRDAGFPNGNVRHSYQHLSKRFPNAVNHYHHLPFPQFTEFTQFPT